MKNCMKEHSKIIQLVDMEDKLREMVIIILVNFSMEATMAMELCTTKMGT